MDKKDKHRFSISKIYLFPVCIFLYLGIIGSAFSEVPSFATVQSEFVVSDEFVLAKDGRVLEQKRTNFSLRRYPWVSLSEMNDNLVKAVVFQEDKTFFEHNGVDGLSLLAGAFYSLFSYKRGSSTISMQVVSQIGLVSGTPGKRSIGEKLSQINRAWELEESWTKEQILETYLNFAYYRGEISGIGAASELLFQKDPKNLSKEDSSILASMLVSPNANWNDILKRACRNYKEQFQEESCSNILETLPQKQKTIQDSKLRKKKRKNGKRTSIDLDLQEKILTNARNHLAMLEGQNVRDMSIIVFENSTGDILAYIPNGSPYSLSKEVNLANAMRQPGSTLKPFLYAQAFEKKYITPKTTLEDSPNQWDVGSGVWRPNNYEKQYHGKVSAKQALASSLNIPAVKVLEMVTVEQFYKTLKDLGFDFSESPGYYGLSLALGGFDTNLVTLTKAYQTISPNSNATSKPFSEQTLFLLHDILSDRALRSLAFGFNNPLSSSSQWAAVKTGTSEDMRDNWCIGFTSKYTIGVWVGNAEGDPMKNVSGVTGAAPIWASIVSILHETVPSQEVSPPPGVIKLQNDYFLEDTIGVEISESVNIRKIEFPKNQTIFAKDPDIPEENERILFQANSCQKGDRWIVNQNFHGTCEEKKFWKLQKGKFQLDLQTSAGKVLDTIRFQVR